MEAIAIMLVCYWIMVWGLNQSFAGVSSTTGAVTKIAPPLSVVDGARESNTEIVLFTERQNFLLPIDVQTDVTKQGFYTLRAFRSTVGVIQVGTLVDCYFIHFDPTRRVNLVGSVTFNQKVLGVMLLDASLNASDDVLGTVGTKYPFGRRNRGLEAGIAVQDTLTLLGDMRKLTLDFIAQDSVDSIRVITEHGLAIQPRAKLATMWGRIKGSKNFDR
jgi:hypothetical protein